MPPVTWTFADIVSDVLYKVENRTADTTLAYGWLRDALLEISGNPEYRDDFVELEVAGPLFNLTATVAEYAEANFISANNYIQASLDFRIWIDPPGNTRTVKLTPRHFQAVDEANLGPSRPVNWYRFGENIGFYPTPDQAYQVQSRVLKVHPIAYSNLATTTILLPVDWVEILKLSAAYRGWIDLEEFGKAREVHAMLFGDPDKPERPGLVSGRVKKRANEQWRGQQSLRPVAPSYSWGRL